MSGCVTLIKDAVLQGTGNGLGRRDVFPSGRQCFGMKHAVLQLADSFLLVDTNAQVVAKHGPEALSVIGLGRQIHIGRIAGCFLSALFATLTAPKQLFTNLLGR